MEVVSVKGTVVTGTPRSTATSGKAGRYKSMAIGPNVVSTPKMISESARPRPTVNDSTLTPEDYGRSHAEGPTGIAEDRAR